MASIIIAPGPTPSYQAGTVAADPSGNVGLASGSNIVNPGVGATIDVSGNVGLGPLSLQHVTSGADNFGAGPSALENTASGGGNVAIGSRTLKTNTSGSFNTGIGYEGLNKNTTGSYNTALGVNSLHENTTGDGSVAFGSGALRYLASGAGRSTAVGTEALGTVTSGEELTAIGYHSLRGVVTNSRCIGIGAYSGKYETGYAKLMVDSIDRGNEASGRTGAIIYGVMDPTPSNQTLKLNASVTIAGTLTMVGATLYLSDDTTIQQNDGFLSIRAGSSGLYLRSNGGSVNVGDAYNVPVRIGAGGGLTTVKNGLLVEAGPTTIAESLKLRVVAVAAAAGTTYLSSIQCVAVLTGTGIETFVLPAISTGRYLVVKNRSTGNLTVDRDGTSTIDGGTSVTVLPGGAIQLVGSGTDWLLVGKY